MNKIALVEPVSLFNIIGTQSQEDITFQINGSSKTLIRNKLLDCTLKYSL